MPTNMAWTDRDGNGETRQGRMIRTVAMSELLCDIMCPGCGVKVPDLWDQRAHMEEHHPDIVRKRLEDAGLVRKMEERHVPDEPSEEEILRKIDALGEAIEWDGYGDP